MSVITARRAALVAALSPLPEIGPVYAYQRVIVKAPDAAEVFEHDERIMFADIEWTRGGYTILDAWEPTIAGPSTYTVRLFRSVRDSEASGLSFSALVEAAIVALSGSLRPEHGALPVELVANDHRYFKMPGKGNVLSHYAELRVTVRDDFEIGDV